MSLTRSSVVVGLLTAVSVAFGLLLNVVTAYVFGASAELDAYLAAIVVPTYVIAIAAQLMSITLIPTFAEFRERDPAKAWTIIGTFINFAVVAASLLVALGMLAAPWIMRAVAPGFADSLQASSAMMLRVYFPIVVISLLNEILASIYYSHHRFGTPLLNKLITPALSIAFVLALGGKLDAMSLVLANLLGAAVQCAILGWGLVRDPQFAYAFVPRLYSEEVAAIVRSMLPLGASMILYKILPVFDRYLMSGLESGSISSLNFASRLQNVAVQIVSSGVTLAVYPRLAQLAAQRDYAELKLTLAKVIRLLVFVSVPIAILSVILGEPILRLIFQHGAFTTDATDHMSACFAIYMIALPVVVIGGVVAQGMYVLRDTRSVAIVGVGETILYVGLCMILIDRLGILAVPIVYGVYFTASVLTLGAVFRWRLGAGGGRQLVRACTIHLVIGMAVGAVVWLGWSLVPHSGALAMIAFVLGCAAFLGVAKALGISEARLLWGKLTSIGR